MSRFVSTLIIILFFVLIFYGLHVGLYALLTKQGSLCLNNITVKGNYLLKSENIIQSSGLKIGQGIFDFYLPDIALNIGTNTLVEFAEVKRIPPDRVEVNIVERKPAGVISASNGIYLCDKSGFILMNGIMPDLPVVILDYNIKVEGSFVKDEYIQLLLGRLSDLNENSRINKIYLKKEGIYLTMKNLDDTLFFLGKSIPDNNTFSRVFSIGDKIKNENIKIRYVDINKENAIGFK